MNNCVENSSECLDNDVLLAVNLCSSQLEKSENDMEPDSIGQDKSSALKTVLDILHNLDTKQTGDHSSNNQSSSSTESPISNGCDCFTNVFRHVMKRKKKNQQKDVPVQNVPSATISSISNEFMLVKIENIKRLVEACENLVTKFEACEELVLSKFSLVQTDAVSKVDEISENKVGDRESILCDQTKQFELCCNKENSEQLQKMEADENLITEIAIVSNKAEDQRQATAASLSTTNTTIGHSKTDSDKIQEISGDNKPHETGANQEESFQQSCDILPHEGNAATSIAQTEASNHGSDLLGVKPNSLQPIITDVPQSFDNVSFKQNSKLETESVQKPCVFEKCNETTIFDEKLKLWRSLLCVNVQMKDDGNEPAKSGSIPPSSVLCNFSSEKSALTLDALNLSLYSDNDPTSEVYWQNNKSLLLQDSPRLHLMTIKDRVNEDVSLPFEDLNSFCAMLEEFQAVEFDRLTSEISEYQSASICDSTIIECDIEPSSEDECESETETSTETDVSQNRAKSLSSKNKIGLNESRTNEENAIKKMYLNVIFLFKKYFW